MRKDTKCDPLHWRSVYYLEWLARPWDRPSPLFRWKYRPLFRGTLIANFGFDLESANELVQSRVQIPCGRKALTFRRVNTKGALSNGVWSLIR